ncbi:MAG: hypothetical protein R3B13_10885 [Polyangiaceae bacterium]
MKPRRKRSALAAAVFSLSLAPCAARADASPPLERLSRVLADLGRPAPATLPAGAAGWRDGGFGAIRGVTVGPIENALHPGIGYGSAACARSFQEIKRMGGSWVSLTPFGRTYDLHPSGVSLSFEAPFEQNREAVRSAIRQAHAAGLRVMLVPHLWVESGEWRALIDPGDDAAWQRWAKSYEAFLLAWAEVARDTGAEMLSVGVELRSWVTTHRAPSFSNIIARVRGVYPGLLTYAANWDDVDSTVILGQLDVIGINAFYPLAEKEGTRFSGLVEGGNQIAKRVRALADAWNKPVMFTEFGYTTRKDPAVKPWEWPDHMKDVIVDQTAQAEAYAALLAPLMDEPRFAGFFVWRVYSDPNDVSQEQEWGFSPRGKLAELVLRDAFAAHWATDGARPLGDALRLPRTTGIGIY